MELKSKIYSKEKGQKFVLDYFKGYSKEKGQK